MTFWVLGSGTTLLDGERGPAGFLLEDKDTRLLIDGGSGTLHRLKMAGVDAHQLDAGVYSHLHLDHCGDLAPILFTQRVARRKRDYPIWGGTGLVTLLEALRTAYGPWMEGSSWSPVVTELPLDGPGQASLPGGVVLDTLPANHSAGALHLRFTTPAGATVVFSGDTGPSENLVELARGVDLLVCECAFAVPHPGIPHLWPEAVAEIVEASRPRRVVLTHFYPEVDEKRALEVVGRCGVPVERAHDVQAFSL